MRNFGSHNITDSEPQGNTEIPRLSSASALIGSQLGELLNANLKKIYHFYAQENPEKSIENLVKFIKTYDIDSSSIDLSFYCLEALKLYHDHPQLIQENHEDFLTILSKYLAINSMIIEDKNIDLVLKMCKVATEKYNNIISNADSKYANIRSRYEEYKKNESNMKAHISKLSEGERDHDVSDHYLESLRALRKGGHIKEYHNSFLCYLNNYLKLVGNISNIKKTDKDFIYKICEYACQNHHKEVFSKYPDIYKGYDEMIRGESIPENGTPKNNP